MRDAGCVVRDDRPERDEAPSLRIVGGESLQVVDNWFAQGMENSGAKVELRDNREKP